MKNNLNKRNLYGTSSISDQTKTVIKITVIVLIIVLGVYFGTAIATGEIKLGNAKKETKEVEIQYDEIIAGQILNRKEDEYYALIFPFTSADVSRYLLLKDKCENLKNYKVYTVDMDKKINQSIITQDDASDRKNLNNINDLKINTSTILKVKDHKIIEIIQGQDEVFKYIKSLYE